MQHTSLPIQWQRCANNTERRHTTDMQAQSTFATKWTFRGCSVSGPRMMMRCFDEKLPPSYVWSQRILCTCTGDCNRWGRAAVLLCHPPTAGPLLQALVHHQAVDGAIKQDRDAKAENSNIFCDTNLGQV